MRTLSQISLEEITKAIKESVSYAEVLRKLDVNKNGGNTKSLQKIIFDNQLSISHFTRIKSHEKNYCLNCGKEIQIGNKYCNSKCKSDYEYKQYINRWKEGLESGSKGKDDISNHVRRYLFETYGKCQCCGWNQVNPYTNLIPLQIHHIDGNCLNNKENNLQLLCPNCHSLTENFGSRNKNATRIDKRIR